MRSLRSAISSLEKKRDEIYRKKQVSKDLRDVAEQKVNAFDAALKTAEAKKRPESELKKGRKKLDRQKRKREFFQKEFDKNMDALRGINLQIRNLEAEIRGISEDFK